MEVRDGCSNDRPRSVATREFVRPPCTRMCVHQGRAKNFLLRPDQQGEEGLWSVHVCAPIFIHRVSRRRRLSTLFSVLPAAPRLDTIGVTHNPAERKTRCETRNRAREIPSRTPSPRFAKLSHTSLFSLSLSLYFLLFFFFCFRFLGSVSRSVSRKESFILSLYTLAHWYIVYLLLENSSTPGCNGSGRRHGE